MRKWLLPIFLGWVLAVPFEVYGHTIVDPQEAFQTIFTPFTQATPVYLDWLKQRATKTLLVADFTFTNGEIASAYCDLARKGVKVQIVLDIMQSRSVKKEKPLIAQMRQAGCEVVLTHSPVASAIMHNKFSVADGVW